MVHETNVTITVTHKSELDCPMDFKEDITLYGDLCNLEVLKGQLTEIYRRVSGIVGCDGHYIMVDFDVHIDWKGEE